MKKIQIELEEWEVALIDKLLTCEEYRLCYESRYNDDPVSANDVFDLKSKILGAFSKSLRKKDNK